MSIYLGAPCIAGRGGRNNIRNRYNLDGDGVSDCASHICCSPCSLTQESREIELEERSIAPAKQA